MRLADDKIRVAWLFGEDERIGDRSLKEGRLDGRDCVCGLYVHTVDDDDDDENWRLARKRR